MLNTLWLIPLAPFAGFLLNGLFGKRAGKPFVTAVALLGSLAPSFLGTWAAIQYHAASPHGERYVDHVYSWIDSGKIGAEVAFQLDPLSIVMLMVVTWMSFLIHLYSVGYIRHEDGYWRYFAYLNLFLSEMLVLILGSSYLLMFVGWEGVGLCSYLLIGFYYKTDYAPAAGKKAFIVNRIGDFGFLVAMFLMFAYFDSVDFAEVQHIAAAGAPPSLLIAICLLLFLGACGKSAQIPLHVWLPDAMAGPTPVSALIHAATMVTAGLYVLTRTNVIFQHSQTMMLVVAVVGAFTAIFAATIGITQNDIKKVLAYSTVSQLGFMFLACGVGAFVIGIFHVMTHAFFKALMFLGAGSVIHGMHHEQDMRRMGGLSKFMKYTYWTFLAGWLAICGIIPFSGFWSKDEILWNAASTTQIPLGWLVWLVGTIAATCTAFYMTRLVAMTFWGKERFPAHEHSMEHEGHAQKKEHATPKKHAHVPHESPKSMWVPLVALAILATVGGFVGISTAFTGGKHVGGKLNIVNWMEPIIWNPATKTFGSEGSASETAAATRPQTAATETEPGFNLAHSVE